MKIVIDKSMAGVVFLTLSDDITQQSHSIINFRLYYPKLDNTWILR